jgi:hypothetical protein
MRPHRLTAARVSVTPPGIMARTRTRTTTHRNAARSVARAAGVRLAGRHPERILGLL